MVRAPRRYLPRKVGHVPPEEVQEARRNARRSRKASVTTTEFYARIPAADRQKKIARLLEC